MESITKSKLSHEQILEMSKRAFGNGVKLGDISEMTDGFFNTAYTLSFVDGLKTVLKVSPTKDVQVMRYEKNLMEAEVYVLNKVGLLGDVPVPRVLYYDKNKEICENEFFFMEFVDGIPLNKIYNKLTEEQRNRISSDLGGFVKRLNSVEGSYFGYISQNDKRFDTWSEAFLLMIKELLEDARDAEVELPYGYDGIYTIVDDRRNVLNMVKIPSLVHKDLWQGNIFVDPETLRITGLIDCERAIYADSLLEPVFGFLLNDESFMKSYSGRVTLNKDEQIRTALYKVYLFLIMVIECTYRQYSGDDCDKWARTQLYTALAELLKL